MRLHRSCLMSFQLLKRLGYSLRRIFATVGGGLPDGFDSALYLQLNPDIKNAGVDPATHYLNFGRHEGRAFSRPAIDILGSPEFRTDRDTILVVSHEASRTGAPVLSLNLVQGLVGHYNVVALLLGGGPLSEAFELTGAAVITASNLRGKQDVADFFVRQLCARFNFKFALINSIESRVVLPELGRQFVPTISLIHEFASYTRPRHAFREALLWSGEVVFSANVTKENAFAEYPDLEKRSACIFPQGQCLLPSTEFSKEQFQTESERIRRLIRPKNADESVIVLGAGFVQLRKGVDLFIECAARVLSSGGDRCRFVWIGKGYDPENDVAYSVYLADQIRRAGLQEHVFFVDETSAIEAAYEEADLLLLSSRLDPLPNVAIDAMVHGVPVLCFNKTTGIADFLIDAGLRDRCVAEYIDTAEMAEKILALANSTSLRAEVADQCRAASVSYFSMEEYVARLERLAQEAIDRTQQEKEDIRVIFDSGIYQHDFSCPLHRQDDSLESEVRAYVRGWASGIDRRKPFPGFHPGIYLEQHGVATKNADPFAEYLRAGRPEGAWSYPVITAAQAASDSLPENRRVALHVHAYYPDLLSEITARLLRNRICPDLFISVASDAACERVSNELKDYPGQVIDIQVVANRGRDIGPFLTAFGPRLMANYDFIGHLHTKKSADVQDAAMAKTWFKFLLENLLGGDSGAMADRILASMKQDASIGMVFPDDPHVVGLGGNRAFADVYAKRIGLQNVPEYFSFPVGTMFWASAAALKPMMNLNLGWDDYPEEPLPYDRSALHALERLFSLSLSIADLRYAVTNVNGVTR